MMRASRTQGQHTVPFPDRPDGQAPQVYAFPVGSVVAGTSLQTASLAQGELLFAWNGFFRQPLESRHTVAPKPSQPGLQPPQIGPFGLSVQNELMSQPPFASLQDAVAARQPSRPSPLPRMLPGHKPQTNEPAVCVRRGSRRNGARGL